MAGTGKGIFGRLTARLAASTAGLRGRLSGLAAYGEVDDEFWELVEETLLTADMGPDVGLKLCADLRAESERLSYKSSRQVVDGLRHLLLNRLEWRPRGLMR